MSDRVFLDTNVLVYLFDAAEQVKQAAARDLLAEYELASLVISAQVLSEFYVTVTRKLTRPLAPDVAAQAVADLGALTVVPTDLKIVINAVATSRKFQLSYWDALILEAAAYAGCRTLLTEDLATGSTIRGIQISDPFVAAERRDV